MADEIHHPHDMMVHAVLRDVPEATSFLQAYLAEDVRQRLNWSTLRLREGSFVDEDLRGSEADFLYQVEHVSGEDSVFFPWTDRPVRYATGGGPGRAESTAHAVAVDGGVSPDPSLDGAGGGIIGLAVLASAQWRDQLCTDIRVVYLGDSRDGSRTVIS